MSAKTKITLAKNGEAQREVEAGEIQIPDLWHVAAALGSADTFDWARDSGERASKAVLEVWHLAHDLRKHVLEREELTPAEALADSQLVVLHRGDLRIAIEMLHTMYDVLHRDQPKCGCESCDCDDGMDLMVEVGSQTRNITKGVPVVIKHLGDKLEEGK